LKVLLLSDIPPCSNYPAGLVLDQLCRFLPQGSLACFCVLSRHNNPDVPGDLSHIQIEYARRPRDSYSFPHVVRPLNGLSDLANRWSHLALYGLSTIELKGIEDRVVEFGRHFGADRLWCVLEGQAVIRLARPVANRLDIPLFAQVFDPPGWELRISSSHRISESMLLRRFASAVRASTRCAVASEAMADQYLGAYAAKTVALLPSLETRMAVAPSQEDVAGRDIVIAVAGQVYATEEWDALLSALDSTQWKLSGRGVRVRILGRWSPPFGVNKPLFIEYLGWRKREDAIRLLSEADILYCPYWLDPQYEREARLSFPSKLTTYLAAGRPILFHGPSYASPAIFLKEHDAAIICSSNESSAIIAALTRLTTDTRLRVKLASNGRTAFFEHLTLSTLRKAFAAFMTIEEGDLVDDASR
jgi:glycosyltransferase involved in cell wall biosynthesis